MSSSGNAAGPLRVSPERLHAFVHNAYVHAGMSEEDAAVIAGALVETELRGVTTHGVVRLPFYVERLQKGGLNPRPNIVRVKDFPATAVIDADNAPGHLGGMRAMDIAVEKARICGVGVVSVRNSDHYGAASIYAMRALPHDMIGVASTNAFPIMAAWGAYGNNLTNGPIAYAIPTKKHAPIVLDISMAAIAMGKVRLAAKAGKAIPEGLVVDKHGMPTTDPNALFDGGSTLPMGMHKGYGMAVVAEVMNGILAESAFLGDVLLWTAHPDKPSRTSHFCMAIDISKFRDVGAFKADVDRLVDRLKASPLMEGHREVLVPGEIEARKTDEYQKDGIAVERAIADDLIRIGHNLGISHPFSVGP